MSLEDSGVLGLDWFEDKITANDDRVPIVLFIPGRYYNNTNSAYLGFNTAPSRINFSTLIQFCLKAYLMTQVYLIILQRFRPKWRLTINLFAAHSQRDAAKDARQVRGDELSWNQRNRIIGTI